MAANNRRHKQTGSQNTIVIALAWYRREQWARLREVSADRADLEDTWEEWVRLSEKGLASAQARGLRVEKVQCDVDELVAWCKEKRQPIDGSARSAFAVEKLRKQNA